MWTYPVKRSVTPKSNNRGYKKKSALGKSNLDATSMLRLLLQNSSSSSIGGLLHWERPTTKPISVECPIFRLNLQLSTNPGGNFIYTFAWLTDNPSTKKCAELCWNVYNEPIFSCHLENPLVLSYITAYSQFSKSNFNRSIVYRCCFRTTDRLPCPPCTRLNELIPFIYSNCFPFPFQVVLEFEPVWSDMIRFQVVNVNLKMDQSPCKSPMVVFV